jgi:hypothetical protein
MANHFKRLMFVALFVVFVVLFMGFNARVTDLFSKYSKLKEIKAEVYQLTVTMQALSTQIAYTTSEAYVEDWARPERRLIQPGDILIIPLESTPAAVLTPVIEITPVPQKIPHWKEWVLLFFSD